MKQQKCKNNAVFNLIRTAKKLERSNNSGVENTTFKSKYCKRIIFFTISITLVLLLGHGFPRDFNSYTANILSIFIGLFITSLIFSLDKFYSSTKRVNKQYDVSIRKKEEDSIPRNLLMSFMDISDKSARETLKDTQSYNFTKKFAFITGYNIFLCVVTLAVLSIGVIFESQFNINIYDYSFKKYDLTISDFINFIHVGAVLLQRIVVLYLFLNILYTTTYIVTRMTKYMTTKMDD